MLKSRRKSDFGTILSRGTLLERKAPHTLLSKREPHCTPLYKYEPAVDTVKWIKDTRVACRGACMLLQGRSVLRRICPPTVPHGGERPFPCEVSRCGYSPALNEDFKAHLHSLKGGRRFP